MTSDIQLEQTSRTGWRITATYGYDLSLYEGKSAGELRGLGFQLPDRVPDCALLKRDEHGLRWSWVKATLKVQS